MPIATSQWSNLASEPYSVGVLRNPIFLPWCQSPPGVPGAKPQGNHSPEARNAADHDGDTGETEARLLGDEGE